jgi:hypothetical protein
MYRMPNGSVGISVMASYVDVRLMAAVTDGTSASAEPPSSGTPEITSISDVTLTHGQTGITINGSSFSASGNVVTISPSDDIDDPDAVTWTVSSHGTTSLSMGAAPLSTFDFGDTLYVFVTNDDGVSNAVGEPITRVIASATLNFTGDNRFVGESGANASSVGPLTFYIWRSPRPSGAPDQTITDVSTNSSGEISLSLDVGDLEAGQRVFFLCFAPDGTNMFSAGEQLPSYA